MARCLVCVVLALGAGFASAMTCMEAFQKMGEGESKCKKQCTKSDDGESVDGVPLQQCAQGQAERSPTSCQNSECGAFLSSFDDATLESMMAAFSSCSGEMAGAAATYTEMGQDYIKLMFLKLMAMDCGLSDMTKFTIEADTCLGGAFLAVLAPDRMCSKQCDEDGADGLRKCNQSEPERSPASCGKPECGDAIAALDDATMAKAIQGMASCVDHPYAPFRSYTMYATMSDGEYIKTVIRNWGFDCDHEDRVALTPPRMDTCAGAYLVWSNIDKYCPKQCTEDPGDSSLPRCDETADERTSDSCRMPKCQNLLAKMKAAKDELGAGFRNCASMEGGESLVALANMIEPTARGVAGQCGYNYEDLVATEAPSEPTPNTPPGGKCTHVSRQKYNDALAQGIQPVHCPRE